MVDPEFETIIKELDDIIPKNYLLIREQIVNDYDSVILDPLRYEICKCITCGLYQASITLTNHLLESSLKKCLALLYSIVNNDPNQDLINSFKKGIYEYDDKTLNTTINKACSEGLISKEQKKILNEFREDFRNAYSHADSSKTFKDSTISGKVISSKDINSVEDIIEACFGKLDKNIKIVDFTPLHGLAQVELAKQNAIPYFKKVDEIIRSMLFNLHQLKQNQ